MQSTKERAALVFLGPLFATLAGGCGPDGTQLLLQGDRLLREGQVENALASLQQAAQLLPKDARAWNHLGLAQHRNRQPADAARSYQRALQLDPALAAARHNLGCLYLEQNKPADAAQEFAACTVFQKDSPDLWLKLAQAQLRAGQWTNAARTLSRAHQLDARHPAVLNGLGLLHAQRRNPRDAAAFFQAALGEKKNFAPALLNLAILTQQHSTNQAAALNLYRDYLALTPRPANALAVEEVARRLDAELQAEQARLAALARPAVNPVTNTPPATVAQTEPAPPKPAERAVEKAAATKLEPAPAPVAVKPAPLPVTGKETQATTAQAKTKARPPAAVVVVQPPALPVTEPAPKAPQVALARPPAEAIPPPSSTTPSTSVAVVSSPAVAAPVDAPKPGFWDRVNPLNLFRSREKPATPLPGDPPKPPSPAPTTAAVATPDPAAAKSPPASPAPRPAPPVEAKPPPPPILRYRYVAPPAPAAGNRAVAQEHFDRAVDEHRGGRLSRAIVEYRDATLQDPAWFEAHFNLAAAALQAGELPAALKASEFALTLKPDATEARNNFALALSRANYPLDAALELRKALTLDPENAQTHFILAGVYARQLDDEARARAHYRKVLELNPRHPQADAIRYWLAGRK
jgi:Flp pilus assembly protein TadD